MAEKLGLGPEIRELKLGSSFRNPRSTAFHTVRYDFKPASVDINKTATIDVGSNNQITVNVPHLDGSATSQTVFKGSQKPYQRECVLIIDRNTGEITLEKLTSNIQVKKTRSESNHKPIPPHLEKVVNNEINYSKLTPTKLPNKNRKDRHTNLPVAKNSPKSHSPAHSSPAQSRASPSKRDINLAPKSSSASPIVPSQQTAASFLGNLPMIAEDDFVPNSSTITTKTTTSSTNGKPSPYAKKSYNSKMNKILIPETSSNNSNNNNNSTSNSKVKSSQLSLSASSSSSSSSSDDSESESDSKTLTNNFSSLNSNVKVSDTSDSDSEDSDLFEPRANSTKSLSMPNPDPVPDHVLKEDLCLSESGSDSD